jgi:hypothetical protein
VFLGAIHGLKKKKGVRRKACLATSVVVEPQQHSDDRTGAGVNEDIPNKQVAEDRELKKVHWATV